MQFYDEYRATSDTQIAALIEHMPWCHLITIGADGQPNVGVFNHFRDGNRLVLHLHRGDQQVADLRHRLSATGSATATLCFTDFLTTVPSYFVDKHYGGAATSWYRYAQCDAVATFITDAHDKAKCLSAHLHRFQPEGGYDPISPDSPLYRGSLDILEVIAFEPGRWTTKMKLGQNRPPAVRQAVATRLRERGRPEDLRAAAAAFATIENK